MSIEERPYPTAPISCACGRRFTLHWNGGELDRHLCACGIEYVGEHRDTVMVVKTPDN